jgi:hypothetical protein
VALTPEIRVSKGAALVAGPAVAGAERVSQGAVMVSLNFPSVQVRVSQASEFVAAGGIAPMEYISKAAGIVTAFSIPPLRTSQAHVLVAAKGRIANPKLRAWTFTLDGHDFYVLRLGDKLTLVYDVYSEQWVDWDAFEELFWPVNQGINWVGGTALAGQQYGSNVLVGDDTYGLLWFLDPNRSYDENPEATDTEQKIFFERVIQGQVPMTGREVQPCYAVWLTTDMGAPAYVGAGVQLEISDDGGVTYDDMGTVDVTVDKNSPELSWYSLGQIEAPGRLFRITDDGAVARIDNMEMNDPDDK